MKLAELARVSFAEGWALTDGLLTPRTEVACSAAVASVLEYPGSPAVLEVSRLAGITEGTQAGITRRRDRLYAEQAALIIAAWLAVIATLDVAAMVRSFRREALMFSGSAAVELTAQQKAALRAQGQQAAAGTLTGAYSADGHDGLIAAILAGLGAAFTLGAAAALAAAAARAGRAGFAWARALAALRSGPASPDLPFQADRLLQAIISGTSSDIGRALAQMAADGATEQEMADAVNAILKDAKAADLWTQDELHAAFTSGQLDQYDIALVVTLDWITEGDSKVCVICNGYEARNPWARTDFPPLPAHPRCRCEPGPAHVIPAKLYRPFLSR